MKFNGKQWVNSLEEENELFDGDFEAAIEAAHEVMNEDLGINH